VKDNEEGGPAWVRSRVESVWRRVKGTRSTDVFNLRMGKADGGGVEIEVARAKLAPVMGSGGAEFQGVARS
jgi:hypothetical protein